MEEWRQIKDYENYSVSSFGNVRNDKYNRPVKNSIDSRGYFQTELSRDGIGKKILTHRLVGETFIENPENKPFIDHINLNKQDNTIFNLRWVDRVGNGRNRPKCKKKCSSIYKGVSYFKILNKWRCDIRINKKLIYLGSFDFEKEAGLAYNEYITKNNLEYFILNEIS
jgi:hypothetical protein